MGAVPPPNLSALYVPFHARDGDEAGEGPVVEADGGGRLLRVLDAGLDDIERRVERRAEGAADEAGEKVVPQLFIACLCGNGSKKQQYWHPLVVGGGSNGVRALAAGSSSRILKMEPK